MVLVEASAGGKRSLGYTYASTAAATLINDELKRVVIGRDATSVNAAWVAMVHHVRNIGRPGIASMAISAIDTALMGFESSTAGAAARDVARPGARRDADLWQRRIHVVLG